MIGAPRDRRRTGRADQGPAAQDIEEITANGREEGAMPDMRIPNNNQPAAPVPIKKNDPMPDFAVMIRVSPNGGVVKNKGGSEELAEVVAYTQRLVELVGELLGLDRFVAMECVFKESEGAARAGVAPRCLVFTEANGDTVALRPRLDSNIQPLRESLGL